MPVDDASRGPVFEAMKLLAEAAEAQRLVRDRVTWPAGYRPLLAGAGAALMLCAALAGSHASRIWAASSFAAVFVFAGVAYIVWRRHQLRTGVANLLAGPATTVMILGMLPIGALVLAVDWLCETAGSWMPGLAAMPVGAGLVLTLNEVSMRTYHRHGR